ncbi:MAG: PAS domain S-box protein [Proteobacteria bacterium]|nr:PAS domain S-box protein [Pseudomonadota bacterium]
MTDILAVDDDRHVCLIVEQLLKMRGYDCATALSASEAREKLKADPVRLILSDVNMPGESGLELLEYVRTAHPDTAVVMMSVMDDPEVARAALDLGAYGYMTKPFESNELLIQVTNALRRRDLEIESRTHAEKLEALVASRTAALLESEKRYRTLIEKMTEGIAAIDESGRFNYANDRFCQMISYARNDLLGRPLIEFVHEEDREKWFGQFERRRQGREASYELSWRTRDGGRLYTIVSPTGHFDEQGRFLGSFAVITDITDRKKVEEDLRREYQKSTALAETSSKLISAASLESISETIMDQALRLTNSRFGFVAYIDPETGYMVAPTMTQDIWDVCQVQGKSPVFKEFSGLWGWVLEHKQAMLCNAPSSDARSGGTPAGHIPIDRFIGAPAVIGPDLVGLVAVANAPADYSDQDMAAIQPLAVLYGVAIQRKRQEEQLLENQRRLRTVMDSIDAGIMIVDAETYEIIEVNPTAARMIGADKEQIEGLSCWEFMCPGKVNCCPMRDARNLGDDSIGMHQLIDNSDRICYTADGREFPIIKTVVPVTLAGRRCFLETFIDNSTRKQVEDDLRASEERYRMLVETMREGIIIMTPNQRLGFFNNRYAEMLGYTREEFEKTSLRHVLDPDSLAIMREQFQRRRAGINEPYELALTKKDGDKIIAMFHPVSLFGPDGRFEGSLSVVVDITTQKRMERQLLQAQKLESIGQLAAGVAHEINTPTQYIHSNVEFLQEAFTTLLDTVRDMNGIMEAVQSGKSTDDLVRSCLNKMEKAGLDFITEEVPDALAGSLDGVRRISRIVDSMKYFSHPGDKQKKQIDVNDAVRNAVTVSTSEWKYSAEVETDLDPNLPLLPCYAAEFSQVLLNLIINAAHAIGDAIGPNPAGKGGIAVRTGQDDGWIEIRISDTGSGIPEEIRSRIFDPFFTTKDVGRGTGQGLAIAHSVIVEKHGGTITFETEVGRGTTFILRLPLETESTEPAVEDR